ncbi:MAG: Stp1/IreP family PP2C-type Ser/Thr phosphatase [Myxococcota bacterium]
MSRARVLAIGDTHIGMKRTHNEDSFMVADEDSLYVVADGMGGHASGEVASKMAIETLREFFRSTSADPEATWPYKMDKSRGYEENRLITGIKLANLRIYETAQNDPQMHSMGTTVAGILVVEEGVLIGHVGDSRVYRIREGKMEQLTSDHSLLNDYIKMKRLSEEEIENFPLKNVIVRALGMKSTVKVDTVLDRPEIGDVYVLCSDGLCGPVSDEGIHRIVQSQPDLQTAANRLIEEANNNGGPDNITVVLAKVMGLA